MLKAFWRWLWPLEAEPTRKEPRGDFVTEKEVRALLAEYMQDIDHEWTDWYDKFNQLHQRLAKREKRSKQPLPEEQLEIAAAEVPHRGLVLSRRRIGSI